MRKSNWIISPGRVETPEVKLPRLPVGTGPGVGATVGATVGGSGGGVVPGDSRCNGSNCGSAWRAWTMAFKDLLGLQRLRYPQQSGR